MKFRTIAAVGLIGLAGCHGMSAMKNYKGPTVTMSQFDKLYTGMPHADAAKVLGDPGAEISSLTVGGTRTVGYWWKGTAPRSNMSAVFQQDKMVSKSEDRLH